MPFVTQQPAAALIKEATADAHSKTEQLLLPHLTHLSSRAGYAAILRMFYGFFHPLEATIQQHVDASVLPDIRERRNARFLLLDLGALGAETAILPLCRRLPSIRSLGAALGALYVLEGSTLGGKMIARMLAKNEALSLGPEHLHFFTGYGEATGPKWTAFISVLNAHEPLLHEMAGAAQQTFECLALWIKETLQHETTR